MWHTGSVVQPYKDGPGTETRTGPGKFLDPGNLWYGLEGKGMNSSWACSFGSVLLPGGVQPKEGQSEASKVWDQVPAME